MWIPVKEELRDEFEVAFWAGISSAIITGIIVGLFILLVQLYIEKKKEIKKYETEILVFKNKLKIIINSPNIVDVHDLKKFQPAVVKTIELINDSPLTIWGNHLKKEGKLIKLLKELDDEYIKAHSHAEKLNNYLFNLIIETNIERGTDNLRSNHTPPYTYFVSKLYGFKDQDVVSSVVISGNEIYEWIYEVFDVIKNDNRIRKDSEKHLLYREELEVKISEIKNVLIL